MKTNIALAFVSVLLVAAVAVESTCYLSVAVAIGQVKDTDNRHPKICRLYIETDPELIPDEYLEVLVIFTDEVLFGKCQSVEVGEFVRVRYIPDEGRITGLWRKPQCEIAQ